MFRQFVANLQQDPSHEYRLFNHAPNSTNKHIMRTTCAWELVKYLVNTSDTTLQFLVTRESVESPGKDSIFYVSVATIVQYDFVDSFTDWWLAHVFDLAMSWYGLPMTNTFADATIKSGFLTRNRAWFLQDLEWVKEILSQ